MPEIGLHINILAKLDESMHGLRVTKGDKKQ
jgi:hypothetical protein